MPTLRISKEKEDRMHFITITILEWINVFTKEVYYRLLAESLEFCRANKGLYLFEYVFMTNHIHLILAGRQGYKLSEMLKSFKSFTTHVIYDRLQKDNREYIPRLLETSHSKKKGNIDQIWQRENKPQLITSNEYLETWQNYIWMNPVKEGYVELPEHWKWSSAKFRLTGKKGPIELDDYYEYWEEQATL